MRVGNSAAGLHEEISFAGDRVVISNNSLERGDLGIEEVGTKVEGAVGGDMAVLQGSGRVEFGLGVVTAKSGSAQGDGRKGKLNRGGKRIPVGLEFWRVRSCRQVNVEIVDLQ